MPALRKQQAVTRLRTILAGLGIVATGFGGVVAFGPNFSSSTTKSPQSFHVLIRHQPHRCHGWAVNGADFSAVRSARVATGGYASFMNVDGMPHTLILTSGPAVRFAGNPSMSHMGATVRVVFPKAGTYRFTTRPGLEYKRWASVPTEGSDNVLRLTVTVS